MAKCYSVANTSHLLLLFALMLTLSSSCLVNILYDKRLVNTTFKIVDNSRLYSCAAECVSYSVCTSFNFDQRNRQCYLNLGNISVSLLKDDREFIYSEATALEHTPLGPCQHKQCELFQRCIVQRNNDVSCVDIYFPSLADGKPATASSSYQSVPGNALDGSTSSQWGTCFHVEYYDNAHWWQVDLQGLYAVVNVTILSRGDCCPERLHDFAVEMYKENPESHLGAEVQLCYMYRDTVTERGVWVLITCNTPAIGRYLRLRKTIKLSSFDVLQFCEVKVFGFQLSN